MEAVVVVTSSSPNGFLPQHTVVNIQFLNYRREIDRHTSQIYVQYGIAQDYVHMVITAS